MYELSIAWSYLRPRWKQLSVSIISLISICVIALVVWLILVFFSVTEGLEKGWMQKLTALTAPIRITPTEEYYNSYYYLVDGISEKTDFSSRSIAQKRSANITDPYNPTLDPEIPLEWPAADKTSDGQLRDIVGETFNAINTVGSALGLDENELIASDFEVATGNIRLRLVRDQTTGSEQRFISQASYINSFDPSNLQLRRSLLQPGSDDLNNMLRMTGITAGAIQRDTKDPLIPFSGNVLEKRLHTFFDHVSVNSLQPKDGQWSLPRSLLPSNIHWEAIALMRSGRITRIFIPQERKALTKLEQSLSSQGNSLKKGILNFNGSESFFQIDGEVNIPLGERVEYIASGPLLMSAKLVENSLKTATNIDNIRFEVNANIQRTAVQGTIPFKGMTLSRSKQNDYFANNPEQPPLWVHHIAEKDAQVRPVLPQDRTIGGGILVAKQFRDHGVLLGDRGYLSYYTPTTSSVQEQRIPIFIAGFYDPGIVPIGGKFITADRSITELIRAGQQQEESSYSNGITVRFEDLDQAARIKNLLSREFQNRGIDRYWTIETFREFEFSKEIAQQLESERNLFSLISMIIIIVPCSNIISMLVILVNDKKIEIGILRSMGATTGSIAGIFGTCGLVMGAAGSLIGTGLAALTMANISKLLAFLGKLQGFDVLNKSFYGDIIPNHLSTDALLFVLAATIIVSLLAGLLPALKAISMQPAAIMRRE